MKVVFSGGGTLGSVTSLIAIYQVLKAAYPDADYLWVGTRHGPELTLIEKTEMRFTTIPSGKLRRYVSLRNIIDLCKIFFGFFVALGLLLRERPSVCISAGGFVSVPLHWAAWCLGIKTWIHQQDVRPGLANKLMAPCATLVTTALKESLTTFPTKKTVWLGNPIRSEIFLGEKAVGYRQCRADSRLPTVLVLGGGTGAQRLNELVLEMLPVLANRYTIVHLFGKERSARGLDEAERMYPTYRPYPFFTEEIADVYAIADVVVSRGGFGTLSELAALQKSVIVIPKAGQQEENVTRLSQSGAVVVIHEESATGEILAEKIQMLFEDKTEHDTLGERLHESIPSAPPEKITQLYETML